MKKFKNLILTLAGITTCLIPAITVQCSNKQTQDQPTKDSTSQPEKQPISKPTPTPEVQPEPQPAPQPIEPGNTPITQPVPNPPQNSALAIKYARENLLTKNEITSYAPLNQYLSTQVNNLSHMNNQDEIDKIQDNFKAMNKVFSAENEADMQIKKSWAKFNLSIDKMIQKSRYIIEHDLNNDQSKSKYELYLSNLNNRVTNKRFDFTLSALEFDKEYTDELKQYQVFMQENLPNGYAVLMGPVADGDTVYGVIFGESNNGSDISNQFMNVRMHNGRGLGVRFRGVDTPETFKNKPDKDKKLAPKENEYAQKAKVNLQKIVEEENYVFYLKQTDTDIYGRWICFFFPNSEMNLDDEFGTQQVREGLARYWYIQDKNPKDKYYTHTQLERDYLANIIKVQAKAQEEKRGFWAENINDVFHVDEK
ncbi:thermonuclease family protein [Mycoplasma sp. BRA285]